MFKLWGKPPVSSSETQEPVVSSTSGLMGGFAQLKNALSTTGKNLIGSIAGLGSAQDVLTSETLDEIEETLIQADLGVDLAVDITDKLRANTSLHSPESLKAFLKDQFTQILTLSDGPSSLRCEDGRLNIYLLVGVNGAGKTTMIGKLAKRFVSQGKSVIVAAGDTFRAAAEAQLDVWVERAGARLIARPGSEPSGVIFEALAEAKQSQADVLIIDTAGRLQNKFNLMEELKKIKAVIDRESPSDAVYESLLVLDATTGQNALRQAEVFKEAVDLSGVILTKIDGSSKGAVVFNIARTYRLPVKLLGVGESIDDIRDFDAGQFIDALFESGGLS